jgi:hypothetical protein
LRPAGASPISSLVIGGPSVYRGCLVDNRRTTVEEADTPELRSIAECARRRLKRWVLIVVACRQ